jgi:signal transduction histidine kinase/ligand-binding sensor domain-containing protein
MWSLLSTPPALAEQLPVRIYTRAQGLPHDRIRCIMKDSRGFLWFCAGDQLSRFDGYRFATYDVGSGPTAIVEESPGTYWVATYGNGVCRFSLAAGAAASGLKIYSLGTEPGTNLANIAYRDSRGRIWAGTDNGLYMLDGPAGESAFRRIELGGPSRPGAMFEVAALVEDREGSLWIGTADGLIRRLPNGRIVHYSPSNSAPLHFVRALLLDRENRLWIGHTAGLLVLHPEPAAAVGDFSALPRPEHLTRNVVVEKTPAPRAAPGESGALAAGNAHPIKALHQFSDGTIMAGTNGAGLLVFEAGGSRRYTTAHGLSDDTIYSVGEDLEGNRWLGTSAGGAMKLEPNGFIGYRQSDGLARTRTIGIFETTGGQVCVIGRQWQIQVFDGRRFGGVQLHLPPPGNASPSSGSHQYPAMQDHTGEWWIASGRGVYRFAPVDRIDGLGAAHPKHVYTTRDGLASNVVDVLFEDSRGDVWIGMTYGVARPVGVVARWQRATQTLHPYSHLDGLPPFARPFCMAEDKAGNLWVGLWQGGLLRFARGRFTLFGPSEGVPPGVIQSLFLDSQNRLWVASSQGGVGRIDHADADRPLFQSYTTGSGLASNNAACFTEDRWRRIYIGTSKGVDRLDPETGRVKHHPAPDGASSADLLAALRDRSGSLWFGTYHGVIRLIPRLDNVEVPPPVWISAIRVPGMTGWNSGLGENHPADLTLSAAHNQLHIDFFGLSFASESRLQYQYRLSGADASDWSPPSDQQAVDFAGLGPGRYRFSVRAVNPQGLTSRAPAVLAFRIDVPVWRTWWFLSIAIAAFALAAHVLHRLRLTRLLELERVRMRIATDLHDDIGASLSQIAILSELANRRRESAPPEVSGVLTEIAGTARDLIDSMGDIVWAIDPVHDRLGDLTHRMRRFAEDLCGAHGIALVFVAAPESGNALAGANLRRQVYLVFKESLHNAVRHSGCSLVRIEVRTAGGALRLTVSDNGGGFQFAHANGGHGLKSIRERARSLGGSAEWTSSPSGTAVELSAPLA